MSKHTPGPWFVTSGGLIRALERGLPGATIADADQSMQSLCSLSGAEIQANAALIAAAPDLLEALEAMYRTLEVPHGNEQGAGFEALDLARAAIAKARGGK